MSTSLDGLQFPISASQQKPSTSKIGRNIISEALGAVDPVHATTAQQEKNWRKQYPLHFKHLVEDGLRSTGAALSIAKQGLETAHASFEFYRDGQKHLLKDVMSLPAQNLNTFQLKGQSEKAPEWYVPYHGKKLQGQELLNQIQSWEERGIVEPSHANALRECIAHPE